MIDLANPSDTPPGRVAAAVVASLGLHLLALLLVVSTATIPDAVPTAPAMSVRMPVPTPVPTPAVAASPAARVAPRASAPRRAVRVAANDQPAASRMAPAEEPGAVAPSPPAPPRTAASPAAPTLFLAASFAADYLDNPQPAYPTLSRRIGEQGRVVLSVRVSAGGDVLAVVVDQSSGRARLDDAAVAAVARWHFVAARLGGAAVESTVLVPLRFSLGN